MSKSVIYATNTTNQVLDVNSVISFGSIVRRFGCNTSMSGGNAVISGTGYYDIDTNFTFTAGAAGTAVITLYVGGVEIPGATVSSSVASGDVYSFSIPTIIRERCNCESTITAVLSGVAGTFNNTSILVEKL